VEFASFYRSRENSSHGLKKAQKIMKDKNCQVIIPTYNEANNIREIIDEIFSLKIPNLDILVVDDNSPDNTAGLVKDHQKNYKNLQLLEREKKMGLGSAYVFGFQESLKNGYDYIFEMDADFSHEPREIPNFITAIQDSDLVIGSRYIQGVNVINWPLSRLILSYGANFYTRIVTGLKIKDSTSGFKCFRRSVLENINLEKIDSDGYSFQIEMNFKAWKKGFRIKEIPIVFVDRVLGTSKMSKKIVREAILEVWRLKLLQIFGKVE